MVSVQFEKSSGLMSGPHLQSLEGKSQAGSFAGHASERAAGPSEGIMGGSQCGLSGLVPGGSPGEGTDLSREKVELPWGVGAPWPPLGLCEIP